MRDIYSEDTKERRMIALYKVKKTSNEPLFYAKYLIQIIITLGCFLVLVNKPFDKFDYFYLLVVLAYLILLLVSFISSIKEIYNLTISDGRLLFEFGGKSEAYTNMEVLKSKKNKITIKASDYSNTKVKMTIKFTDYNEKIEFLNSYCKNQDFCEEGV